MQPELIRLPANGLDFACLTLGTGPLVVLLHGFPDQPAGWTPIMQGLARAGFRAVAPATRGYYPTEIPPDGDYRIATLARDALAIVEALGAEKAAVVGHDWGASTAFAAANLGRDRIVGLSALAIPHPRLIKPSLELVLRARHFALFQLGPVGRWWARRHDMAYLDYLYRYWSPTWPDPSAHIAAIKADFRQPGRLDAALGYYAQLSANLKKTKDNELIREVTTQPSLLFVGVDDGALRFEKDFVGIEDCFSGPMDLVHVAHAGHFIPEEQPQAVLDALVPFLRGLPW